MKSMTEFMGVLDPWLPASRVGVHLPQVRRGLEVSCGGQVARPFDMDGPRHGAAAARTDGRAEVLSIRARVQNDDIPAPEGVADLFPGRQRLLVARAGPVAWRR